MKIFWTLIAGHLMTQGLAFADPISSSGYYELDKDSCVISTGSRAKDPSKSHALKCKSSSESNLGACVYSGALCNVVYVTETIKDIGKPAEIDRSKSFPVFANISCTNYGEDGCPEFFDCLKGGPNSKFNSIEIETGAGDLEDTLSGAVR